MPSGHAPEIGAQSALLRFIQAYARFAIDDMVAALKQNELSMPQLAALQHLNAVGVQSVSAIADHLNLSRTATSHLVDRLVRRALVTRDENQDDRRHKSVGLSAGGHELIAELNRRSAATLTVLLQRVPQAKREALEVALLDVLNDVAA